MLRYSQFIFDEVKGNFICHGIVNAVCFFFCTFVLVNEFMGTRIIAPLLLSALVLSAPLAQASKKTDKKTANRIRTDITFLASDDLEGRRTSTEGERKASDYIQKRYETLGIPPYKGAYKHPFNFVYGKDIAQGTTVTINKTNLKLKDDGFPLPFSGTKKAKGEIIKDVMEQGNFWLLPLYADTDQLNSPHFEAEKYMFEQAKEAEKKGASGVVFYDGYGSKNEPGFGKMSDYETLGIPVVFLKYPTYKKFFEAPGAGKSVSVELNIDINKTERKGTNLAAFIDNKAKYTVVLGAHYDHLGYGEDENSLYANAVKEHKIHHGADDNASGTAALLEEAKWIKENKSSLSNFNYLFVNFSGEELGLFGSKAFIKEQKIDSANFAYMINMDMVGRLNDSTHALTLGGVGTSPTWAEIVKMAGDDFKLVLDSAGVGPSDHASFYSAGIPVLFFFTGTHHDYHKPSDIAASINYEGEVKVLKYVDDILVKMDKDNQKPKYLVTKNATVGNTKFKVTLGIMPDYSFQDGGVRIDGVTDNRPAAKAGLLNGDVITQLGEYKIQGIHTYMDALGKFTPGTKTTVTFQRGGKQMVLPIELMGK